MTSVLRLIEDTLAGSAPEIDLPAAPRMIFVVHGAVTVGGRRLTDGETYGGDEAVSLRAEQQGATVWRFELAWDGGRPPMPQGPGIRSVEKLSASLATMPVGDLLLRGDSVAFPPGGCAHPHRHQGPGIRCLLDGAIRIDTHGASTSYGPGGAWYESGPDQVFAQAAADRSSRFIRVMVLPRALLGKSSFQFVNEADKAKPRDQQYQVFVDHPIARPS